MKKWKYYTDDPELAEAIAAFYSDDDSKYFSDDPELRAATDAFYRDGEKGLEPLLAKYRIAALLLAKEADMEELAGLVRAGTELNEAERDFVADLILGKIPPKQGRPPKAKLTRRIGLGFYWLIEHDGEPLEAAIARLMAIHDKSRTTILEHKKKADTDTLTQDQIRIYKETFPRMPNEVLNSFKERDLTP